MSAWTTSLLYQARTLLPRGAVDLACHAAVPAVLDPGFLHLLRINFFLDPPVVLDHEVEASLLHSPLFHETGDGLYELDPPLRRRLLAGLDAAYGLERLKKVALLLEQYTNAADPWQPRELEYAQRLTALSMVEPGRAEEWLAGAQQSRAGQETLGQEWFVAMRQRLAAPDSLASELALLRSRVLHPQPTKPETVRALGELALLPGADVNEILNTLVLLSDDHRLYPLAAEIAAALRVLFPSGAVGSEADGDGMTLLDLLGPEPWQRADLGLISRRRSGRDFLRVPIGLSHEGEPVLLDLKGPAQEGMGPHGLLVGTTGSGKTELLRTLVTALALTHPSDQVNFLLIDPYGGAAFAPFERLPHTSAVITDLQGTPGMIDRLSDAISGELVRRQDLLRRSGDLATVREYEQARPADAEPLPTLLVIIDEFNALLAAAPNFIDQLVQIGRLGRSLGVHLLLSSSRIEEGRMRGLDTHLSYRLGLRMFSTAESRTVLGLPDAYELPAAPGHGYLRYAAAELVRFKAVSVSEGVPTLLESAARSLQDHGRPAHQVWLPPLDRSPALDELGGPIVVDPERGLRFAHHRDFLEVPIALVDLPFEQKQDVFWLRLTFEHNVVLVGRQSTGKSTTLRAFVCALALTQAPEEAQVYCLDLAGQSLQPLRLLPNVGAVAGPNDREVVRRVIDLFKGLLHQREQAFLALGIDAMAEYRRLQASGSGGDADNYGEVFLVVDDWSHLHSDFAEFEPAVLDLATRGRHYGIHVVATARRWSAVPPLESAVKLEFRLEDPAGSAIDRDAAAEGIDRPGHGITIGDTARRRGSHLVTARPELTTMSETALIESIDKNWRGRRAPRISLLPDTIPYEHIGPELRTGIILPVGVADYSLVPVRLHFGFDPHLVVSGDAGSGKTTFLRALATTITRQCTPDEAQIVVIDLQRSLLGTVPSEYLLGYAENVEKAAELVSYIVRMMDERLPRPPVTAEQMRDRSWWNGPEVFVLVDNYELVAGDTNPLLPLRDFVIQAGNIGLHLVITHRQDASPRTLNDRLMSHINEVPSSSHLVLSGRSDAHDSSGNEPLVPGRGHLVSRRRITIPSVQLYDLPPSA